MLLQLIRYLSDVAAILGLWLGCSILSLMEFVEFGLDAMVLLVQKITSKQDKKPLNIRPSSAKVKPMITTESRCDSLDVIDLTGDINQDSGSSKPTGKASRISNTRRIVVPEKTHNRRRSRRGSIFDIFDKKATEDVYKVNQRSELCTQDEGYSSENSSPTLLLRSTTDSQKHGRWKPLHVAVHEKFLFGPKQSSK